MLPSRPPASLHHVRRWVIGSGSSHYGVPVECSSSSPLMRGLCFSPSHWTGQVWVVPPMTTFFSWAGELTMIAKTWNDIRYTDACTHIRKLILSLLIQHSDWISFDYTTTGYILKFSSAGSRSLVAFVNCNNQMFNFGSSFEGECM